MRLRVRDLAETRLSLLLLAGCTIHGPSVDRHVIIGFGVVSVAHSTNAVLAVKTQMAGLRVDSAQLTVGILSCVTLEVPQNASNVVVETTSGLGRFKVKTR